MRRTVRRAAIRAVRARLAFDAQAMRWITLGAQRTFTWSEL